MSTFLCGAGPHRPVGESGKVRFYRFLCPWCAGLGRWYDGDRCWQCASTGITDDPSPGIDFSREYPPGVEPPTVEPEPLTRPPAVMRAPCLDCAYRPGSPEGEDVRPDSSSPFFCHAGMRRTNDPEGGTGYQPTVWVGSMPLGYFLCAGWYQIHVEGKDAPAAAFRDPGGSDRASVPPPPTPDDVHDDDRGASSEGGGYG